jgi:hypothetical protein
MQGDVNYVLGTTATPLSMTAVNIWNTPLTANRTIDLSSANGSTNADNLWDGADFIATRTANATGAFTLTIINTGGIPASVVVPIGGTVHLKYGYGLGWMQLDSAGSFSALAGGTNTTAAMVVGTGASVGTSGSGTIAATSLTGLTGMPTQANQTVLGNGSGSSAVPVALTLGGNLAATATGLTTSQAINAQTGTSYAMATTDGGKLVTFSNAGSVAVSLSQATTAGFTAGYSFDVENLGAGLVTLTPATSTVNGAATLRVPTNTGCTVTSDGTNYQISACTASANIGPAYTVSTLPACAAATKYQMMVVTDALTPTYNGALTGGSSTVIPVFCNGTSWTSH